ncbi:multidrug ABC transporter ATP-binding protein [Pedobacter sp. KBW06]|uniref:ABC transporter ATP-binding protein n=1 Tax=Pedobacter sp. KBW06 TaxID=2153359 RepID=UPI000F5AF15A|nr:ABC transporter ATP-binding protein [Pedobacter sp. KBW06]RQO75638.1 multidrug ABC transporter ATP-binding protein [Pedobacter sp. KBW06]
MKRNIVKIENLSHRYHSSWAIRDINFEIDHTGIVGLLGSNGAGKSTTMNILCGVLNQTEGNVYIDGIDLHKDPLLAKRQIGFLPQTAPLHQDLSVDEYLNHCAFLRLMDKDKIKRAIEEVKEKCAIAHFGKRLIRNLSGGYRQRVGIAQAIIHYPKLVVLDEPTNGLDPNQIMEIRTLIREIARDRTVIFSTHILSEVQALCKEIKMIEEGQLVFSDSIDAFNNYVAPHCILMMMDNPPKEEDLISIKGITKIEMLTEKRFRLSFDGDEGITEEIIKISVEKDWKLREISVEKNSIDEIFAQLSKKTQNKNSL